MTTTHPHKDYLLVEVLKYMDAFFSDSLLCITYMYGGKYGEDYYPGEAEEIQLPPGKWQLIGLASTLSDEQWEPIVDWINKWDGWKDYSGEPGAFDNPTDSGLSLIASKNLTAQNCLILKKL